MSNGSTGGAYDFAVKQGQTLQLSATWKNSAGTAIDLTGYTAAMDIVYPADDSLLCDVGTEGTIALGGAAGTITITVAPAVTAGWAAGVYAYDLFLTSAGGVATPLLEGSVTVKARRTS